MRARWRDFSLYVYVLYALSRVYELPNNSKNNECFRLLVSRPKHPWVKLKSSRPAFMLLSSWLNYFISIFWVRAGAVYSLVELLQVGFFRI